MWRFIQKNKVWRSGAISLALALALGSSSSALAAGEIAPGFSLDGTLYNSPTGSQILLDSASVRV